MLYDANKIVELNRNSVNNIEAGSWRKQLSAIMNKRSGSAAKIADSANWGNTLDVNPNIDLLLTSVPELSFKNSYEPWVGKFLKDIKGDNSNNSNNSGFIGKLSGLMKTAGAVITAGSAIFNSASNSSDIKTSQTFSPWVQNVPAWKTADQKGIEITTSFSFAMGQYGLWNAREEVVKPLLNLSAPTLLQNLNSYSMAGPFPNSVYLLTNLMADAINGAVGGIAAKFSDDTKQDKTEGQSSTTDTGGGAGTETKNESNSSGFLQLASDGLNKLATYLEDFVLDSFKSYTFTIQFGKFLTLNNMMIKDSKLQFSDQVDQYGYPVEGSCTLTMQGIIPISLTTSNVNTLAAKFGS